MSYQELGTQQAKWKKIVNRYQYQVDKDVKAVIIKMLQHGIANTLEANEKNRKASKEIKNLNKKIEGIKKNQT